jgi:hypothetical protein
VALHYEALSYVPDGIDDYLPTVRMALGMCIWGCSFLYVEFTLSMRNQSSLDHKPFTDTMYLPHATTCAQSARMTQMEAFLRYTQTGHGNSRRVHKCMQSCGSAIGAQRRRNPSKRIPQCITSNSKANPTTPTSDPTSPQSLTIPNDSCP